MQVVALETLIFYESLFINWFVIPFVNSLLICVESKCNFVKLTKDLWIGIIGSATSLGSWPKIFNLWIFKKIHLNIGETKELWNNM